MSLINLVFNSALLNLRIGFQVITVGVILAIVAATITMSIIILKGFNDQTNEQNPFVNEKVVLRIVQSTSTIAINRNIYGSELDYYYNASQALQTSVDDLYLQLTKTLSSSLLKIIVLDFSDQPVIQNNSTDQPTTNNCSSSNNADTNEYGCRVTQSATAISILNQTFPLSTHISDTTSVSTSNIPYQTSTKSLLPIENMSKTTFSAEISSSLEVTEEPFLSTNTGEEISSIKNFGSTIRSSTVSYSTERSSFGISSTFSSLFSSFLSTKTTSFQPPTTHNGSPENCEISQGNSSQLSLIFLKVTMYFNNTVGKNITKEDITNALFQYAPNVVLITECNTASSTAGSFNTTKSMIQPPVPFVGNISSILAQDTIPDSLANSIASVTPPSLLTTTTNAITTTMSFTLNLG